MVILSLVGIGIRLFGMNFQGVDMRMCLLGWTDKMIEDGRGLRALKEFSGDYNMPYATLLLLLTYLPIPRLYSIKALSIIFDFLLAGELAHFFRKDYGEKRALTAYGIVMLHPIVILNSAFLGQCDVIYIAFAVLSFLYLEKDQPVHSMIALALAFSFKLQSIFILPILIVLYWRRKKMSLLHLLILPVVWEIVCIPAILAGRGLGVFYSCYLNQTGSYEKVYYYYPNLWGFFQMAPYYVFGKIAVLTAMVVMALMLYLIVKSDYEDYGTLLVWMAMGCVLFLPSMHERYAFLPEVMLPVIAIVRKNLRVPALVLVLSTTACYLCSYFYNTEGWPPYAMSAIHLGVFFYITWTVVPKLLESAKKEVTE